MHIREEKLPRARQLARSGPELSREALVRLAWMDFYRTRGRNAARTCRHFGISRETFYTWRRRFDPHDLHSLESRSHRPHHRRQPTWTPACADQVLRLRLRFPRWGKDKLVVLLGRQGLRLSTSMVGRILRDLKKRGVLVEPLRSGSRRPRRWLRARPYAVRKPKEYRACQPGDLVQVDTLDVRPLPGVICKHFTARDVVSRWDVLQAHTRATAATATQFLVLPPRSPKLNGAVERAQRTHTEEFYQVTNCSLEMAALNRELREWERTYNTFVRTNRSATSLPLNTCSDGTPIERTECVTNLLDEFSRLQLCAPRAILKLSSMRTLLPSFNRLTIRCSNENYIQPYRTGIARSHRT